ncbi:amidohydrolase [Thalassotalea euphylliae]|uniref:Amidohydrolase n=1 Tax=Thalassotalea euphylliae TaxID=1655234 RepID=A0A3E0TX75_9GAMM|nr:amidohydrolase [Thalassotalea euphylliae]REL28943.1 amidohydrolase [Thalassotalea euphylliae]
MKFKFLSSATTCFVLASACVASAVFANDITADLSNQIVEDYDYMNALYRHLHQYPELSKKEHKTSQRLAEELEKIGYTVTRGLGGTGLVAILENGDGPTLMLRADMDALPVAEQTSLPYASQVKTLDDAGNTVSVMHACGHDIHMTVVLGTARQMAANKATWQGRLMLVLQPAEEIGYGAKAMLSDGLFTKFPTPDYNLTMHVSADLPAGTIGYVKGYAMANVDSVDIRVKGQGGHGAYPHKTKDPVVIAAGIIMQLQTIVSREISPLESSVITVGSIHGGTKHNIIGNAVDLQLTVRSYSDSSRDYLLKRIKEISEGVAMTAGLSDDLLPVVKVKNEYTPAVYNQPEYTQGVVTQLKSAIGDEQIIEVPPVMAGEDFSRYGRTADKIPSALLWLGAVNTAKYQQAKQQATSLPSLHSPKFAPDPEPTIKTGIKGMTSAALMLLAKAN